MKHKQVMSHDVTFHALLDFFLTLDITLTVMKKLYHALYMGGGSFDSLR